MVLDQSVLIIGRGIAGLSVAYALSRRGIKVIVIGPADPSATATAAAVGLSSLKGQFHAQKPLFAAKVDGHLALWSWLAELEAVSGISVPRFQSLAYEPYWSVTEFEYIRERVFHRSFSGHTGALLGPLPPGTNSRFVQNPLGSAIYDGDLWYDPRACLVALESAVVKCGGRIADWEVVRIEATGSAESRLRVVGRDDSYESPHVILAAGIGCDRVLQASGIKGPKQKAVFGETLVFDKIPHSSPHIIHMGKKHLVACQDRILFGSSSVPLVDDGDYVGAGIHPGLDLDPRIRRDDFNNNLPTTLRGVRGRYADLSPSVGPLKVPGSAAKVVLFSGFYKSGLQLAPLFAAKLANYYDGSSAFLCDSQFSVARFQSDF